MDNAQYALHQPHSCTHSFCWQIDYPEIADDVRPRHRFMSAYEQRVEPPDRLWQYLLFSAEPYETIAFKVGAMVTCTICILYGYINDSQKVFTGCWSRTQGHHVPEWYNLHRYQLASISMDTNWHLTNWLAVTACIRPRTTHWPSPTDQLVTGQSPRQHTSSFCCVEPIIW